MKILFVADIHLKLGQKGVPIDWSLNRYDMLFKELARLQNEVDMFIIGGDIFDKIPGMDELELYYDLVDICHKPTIIYPGNHEATKKGKTFFSNLKKSTNKLNPLVTVVDDYTTYCAPDRDLEPLFDIIPYNKLKEYEKSPYELTSKLLFTHVRGEIPPHVKPEIDLALLDKWDLVVAGDLHSYENSQRNILYPGSPITTSFHRAEVETGVLVIDTDTLKHEWIKLDLPQLIRKTIQVGDIAEPTTFHHTLYEIEGDMSQLSEMGVSDIVDRKVVKRSSETTLMLDPTMTIVDEMVEYLKYVLMLDDQTVDEVLQEYNNHATKLNTD